MKLAAYCLLVEESHGMAVKRGQLQYLNRSIEVAFDEALRERLMGALEAIRQAQSSKEVARNHRSSPAAEAAASRQV